MAIRSQVHELGYAPRLAFVPFHQRTQRWGVMICHRRAGKTVAAINDLIKRTVECWYPHPRFAFMAPTRVRAKEIAWEYLKRFTAVIVGIKVSESELYIEFPDNHGRVTIYGADNDRAMGLYIDGIVFDECDEIRPDVYDVVLPALSDRKGWAIWMGVLKGRHNLLKRMDEHRGDPDWFTLELRASESGILPDEELRLLKDSMAEVAYALQMELDANASVADAIYGREMDKVRKENRIRSFPYDKSVPLFTFWDIGHTDSQSGDATTIWLAQFIGRDILLLDYFARNGEHPGFYAAKVKEWEALYQCKVQANYLPHDSEQRHAFTGMTYNKYLADAGLKNIRQVPRIPDKWLGINELRIHLGRCYFHAINCAVGWRIGEKEMPSGIDCIDYYRKKTDSTTGIIRDVPVHDEYSHGADALRTMAEAIRQGMIEGTSFCAREGDQSNYKVLLAGYNGVRPSNLPRPYVIRS